MNPVIESVGRAESLNARQYSKLGLNRRNFLKFPLAATALAMAARGVNAKAASPERVGRGFRVEAQKDRQQAELLIMGGPIDLKVASQDTGGDLSIFETFRKSKGGPPLHRHHFQDEWFYVIRGEFIAQVGDDTFSLHPGDSVFAPRKIPHAFANIGEGDGQMLFLFQPAGSMEDFFKQANRISQEAPGAQAAAEEKLWKEHGLEVVGPPLKF